MGDLAREQQLLLEPAFDLVRRGGISGDFRTNDFERDRHFQFGIPRLIHRAHTADPELFYDVVTRPELLSDLERSFGSFRRRGLPDAAGGSG